MATRAWQTEATDGDARRDERRTVEVGRASVRGHGDQACAATLLDLSIYGCRITSAATFQPEARLWLRLDGGWPIAASVVWVKDDQLGCRFDQPIANALMRQLTREQGGDRPVKTRPATL